MESQETTLWELLGLTGEIFNGRSYRKCFDARPPHHAHNKTWTHLVEHLEKTKGHLHLHLYHGHAM